MALSLKGILSRQTDGRIWRLSAAAAAGKCGLSRRQFCGCFRAENGSSFSEYKDGLRLAAIKCGLSRRQFCRCFKAESGLSFCAYKNKTRLTAIMAALNRFNGRKLKNFDYRAFKFATYPSFSRSFKRRTGMSPSRYLRRPR